MSEEPSICANDFEDRVESSSKIFTETELLAHDRGQGSDEISSPNETSSNVSAGQITDQITEQLTTKNQRNETSTTQATFDLSATRLQQAFAGLKVERGEKGNLKIEAEGESAAILASVFKGMAEMFSSGTT